MKNVEQKFVPVMALRDGAVTPINASDGKDMGDIFAGGWIVRAMASPGPEGFVLLLMERESASVTASGGRSTPPGWG